MKIYDGFQFFNELELLEVRFNELYDVVDHFVIVECTKTHQNKVKPLHFWDNKEKFTPFLDKVIHHVFDPEECPYPWYIENEQRNQLKNANFSLEEGDIFLLSDADEILSKDTVIKIKENHLSFQETPHTSAMQMSYSYINTVITEPRECTPWLGTVVIPYNLYKEHNLQFFRDRRLNLPVLDGAGWHLSFIGGAERIKCKIESYAHSEFNLTDLTDLNKINSRIKSFEDPLARGYVKIRLEEDLSKFPESSLKFKHLFY
jgi:beta-1,4-mannosyl-glycoprotein beta-1,4-N-acetylglucosaminyltransferase